jgi:hypothetical protein
MPTASARSCGSAIQRCSVRRRAPRPRVAVIHRRARRCRLVRRRRPASPRATIRPAPVAAAPRCRACDAILGPGLRAAAARTLPAPGHRHRDGDRHRRRAAFRASAALTALPSSLFFPARIGAGVLRPHRPHRSRRWISTEWRGRFDRFLALTVRILGYRPRRRPLETVGGIGFCRGRGLIARVFGLKPRNRAAFSVSRRPSGNTTTFTLSNSMPTDESPIMEQDENRKS